MTAWILLACFTLVPHASFYVPHVTIIYEVPAPCPNDPAMTCLTRIREPFADCAVNLYSPEGHLVCPALGPGQAYELDGLEACNAVGCTQAASIGVGTCH